MNEDHPALAAARSSWRCVESKDKAGWLALMADEITIEDPIGRAPTNPTGRGVRGKDEVAAFYDRNIAPATIRFQTHESFAAGLESAHLLTLTTTLESGMTVTVHGIFTYRINEDGKLTSLRGYWSLEDAKIDSGA
jgi:steroid delta-isomerase